MSKKKKKKPYRSVLDESLTKDKPADGSSGDIGPEPPEECSAAGDIADGNAFLPEDESISDVPPPVSGRRSAISPETASKITSVRDFKRSDTDNISSASDNISSDAEKEEESAFGDGFPEDTGEYGENGEDYVPSAFDRAIQYASMFLSVLLLGGSIVFWFTTLRYLTRTPFALADPAEMRTLLICCTVLPVIVAAVQHYLKRPVSAERWLICLCASGAAATVLTIISQAMIRRVGFSVSELPLILCCAFSGCTLPSVICTCARALIDKFRLHIITENSLDWQTVRSDILSLTDFHK